MKMTQGVNQTWTVIFLVDKTPVEKIVLLHRSANHKFAPHYCTGIGGKVENDETPVESAYRELKEETGLDFIALNEFARCHIQEVGTLHYFWGKYLDQKLPECTEGSLEWVDKSILFSKKLIPTTEAVCLEWKKREFRLDNPFTVIEKVLSVNDVGARTVQVVDVIDGLQ